ncbi:MAG: acetoacetate--CoA ligase, partial [Rhodospirillaceae bacterium]|nr:acetoacetate--CoA ligase [Rhodospirillaceae bacterium]
MASRMMWQPGRERIDAANMTAFMQAATDRWGTNFSDYAGLHAWSVNEPEKFWTTIWEFCDVVGEPGGRVVVDREKMPGARF